MSLVSIIIPVYNVEAYLPKCIESLLCQTYENIEIILVDDGSKDKCPQICDQYAQKDERIKVIHKKNGGVSSARNAGIEIANGEYITFCDSDDYVDNDFVKEMYETIIAEKADSVTINLHKLSNKNGLIKSEKVVRYEFSNEVNKKEFLLNKIKFKNGNWNVYCNLFKHNIIKENKIMFNTNYSYSEDLDFVLKYHMHANSNVWLQKELYYYCDLRDSSEMNRSKNKIRIDALNGIGMSVWEEYKKVFNECNDFNEIYHEIIYVQLYRIMHIKKLSSLNNIDYLIKNLVNKDFFDEQMRIFYHSSSLKKYVKEYGLIYGLGIKNVDKYLVDKNVLRFKIRYIIWYGLTLPLKIIRRIRRKEVY